MDKEYNRIVLIGNGFDRSLDLKTSYSDFIFDYLQKVLTELFKNNDCSEYLFSIKDMNVKMSQNINLYIKKIKEVKNISELLDLVKEGARIIYKYPFFDDLVSNLGEARWVDIEQYYFDFLKREFRIYKSALGNRNLTSIIDLNKCMDELTFALNDYIFRQQIEISLKDPLYNLLSKIHEPLKHGIANLVKEHRRQNSPSEVLFLNFNYTNTISQIINNSFIKGNNKQIFIHGKVDDKENPIIFGYGDDIREEYKELEIEGENELLKKIKSFQYPRTHNYHNLLNYLESKEYDVFIVGHSCGLSDRTMLKTIFEHHNCLAIQNFHYKGESEDFEKRMEISRHFSDKVLMRERVLPYDNLAVIPQIKMN